ncbi:hypothetical protein JCM30237_01320 [Halolamina litorea]|uniref:Signal peptidase I n=1 Tax=Halolamina litorea TaxID=1515593 RepID=A0ABD6BRT9_9EURY|nr:signal peptidase I [Halolamina litorea]
MSRFGEGSARHVVGFIVLLLVIAPFAAYAAPALVGADESYIVLTGSMRPGIDPGDVVFVSATSAASIGVDDVITYTRPGSNTPTTHRVVEVVERDGDRLFRTQGDANEDPDSALIAPEQVVGVVTLTIPFIGTVIGLADSQYGFLALVVLPFGLLVLDLGYSAVSRRVGRPGGASEEDADVPVVYDPVRAAEAYYDAAERRLSEAERTATPGVSARDMSASMLLAAGLAIYAGWNAYWQFTSFGAPRAETMSVLSGALVCLAFLGYLRVTNGGSDEPAPATAPGTPGVAEVAPVGAAPSVARPQAAQHPAGVEAAHGVAPGATAAPEPRVETNGHGYPVWYADGGYEQASEAREGADAQ